MRAIPRALRSEANRPFFHRVRFAYTKILLSTFGPGRCPLAQDLPTCSLPGKTGVAGNLLSLTSAAPCVRLLEPPRISQCRFVGPSKLSLPSTLSWQD
jgi:hypothetical protein